MRVEAGVSDQHSHSNAGTNHGAAGANVTRRLAEFSAALTFDDLPREVVSKAKLCILDTLGCCIFGASLEPLRKLTDMAVAEGCAGRATIFGNVLRTSPGLAALVNGTAAHAFQLDEIHLEFDSASRLARAAGGFCRRRSATIGQRPGPARRHCCELRSRHPDRIGG